MSEIRNALTGHVHTDKFTGTRDETEFYRVMPLGSTQKLFFDNVEQYAQWRVREYVESRPELSDKQMLEMATAPFDFSPAPLRTDFLSCYSGKS